jgi:hypothetical protein
MSWSIEHSKYVEERYHYGNGCFSQAGIKGYEQSYQSGSRYDEGENCFLSFIETVSKNCHGQNSFPFITSTP